MKSEPSN